MSINYFRQAIEDARRYRDQVVEPQMHNPYVRVVLPIGESSFPRCDADEFVKGVLTITSMDDGYVMREYRPGEWLEVVAYDAFGHLSYMRVADLQTGTATP